MYSCRWKVARWLVFTAALVLLNACGGSSGQTPPEEDGNGNGNGGESFPTGLAVSQVNSTSVTLTWEGVQGAESYRIYYASEPIADIDNIHAHEHGDWIADVSSPHTVTDLSTNITYHFVTTAMVEGEESAPSNSVTATPVEETAGPEPTAEEVRMVELVNRARFDPEAELDRYDAINDLNEDLQPGTISSEQKPPLAFNEILMQAARGHSAWMLETNTFSHTGEGGSSPQQRIRDAGYGQPTLSAENISVVGGTQLNLAEAIDDHHRNLFLSSGHRVNIFRENARELGVGQEAGDYEFENMHLPSAMLTQKFATIGSDYFITGVVYEDANNNGIYDVGEGMANVVVTIDGTAYPVYEAGIYSVPVANNGTYRVTVAGGQLPEPVETEVQVMSRNVKLDVVLRDEEVDVVSW